MTDLLARLWRAYWASITWPIAILSNACTAVILVSAWSIVLKMPEVAKQQGVDPARIARAEVFGVVVMIFISLFVVYLIISMFAAASDNSKRQRR